MSLDTTGVLISKFQNSVIISTIYIKFFSYALLETVKLENNLGRMLYYNLFLITYKEIIIFSPSFLSVCISLDRFGVSKRQYSPWGFVRAHINWIYNFPFVTYRSRLTHKVNLDLSRIHQICHMLRRYWILKRLGRRESKSINISLTKR